MDSRMTGTGTSDGRVDCRCQPLPQPEVSGSARSSGADLLRVPLKERRRFAVSPFREEREQRKHEAEGRHPPAPRELWE